MDMRRDWINVFNNILTHSNICAKFKIFPKENVLV